MGLEERFRKLEQPFKAPDGPPPVGLVEVRHDGWESMTDDQVKAAYDEAKAEALAHGWSTQMLYVDLPPKSWREAKAAQANGSI